MADSTTVHDLKDYEAIHQYVPEATPKQVKWIKEMLDMARQLGFYEPVGENILKPLKDIDVHQLKTQCLAGIKSSLALFQKKRTQPTAHEDNGQLGLFHPEAFQGGDNQTLRQM